MRTASTDLMRVSSQGKDILKEPMGLPHGPPLLRELENEPPLQQRRGVEYFHVRVEDPVVLISRESYFNALIRTLAIHTYTTSDSADKRWEGGEEIHKLRRFKKH
ncbi:hypothetical protein Tcan_04628 [Toxocara canis]|uniref:Uncharacterized protein n=1 Tax=Toxocara canis TaxID=6265 RepID=A0A0B2VH33_TOXCA|nr:hypothetical protein Tcan_04628 [Toxocara canis]